MSDALLLTNQAKTTQQVITSSGRLNFTNGAAAYALSPNIKHVFAVGVGINISGGRYENAVIAEYGLSETPIECTTHGRPSGYIKLEYSIENGILNIRIAQVTGGMNPQYLDNLRLLVGVS